jgi:CheY-like chemotaxis protein
MTIRSLKIFVVEDEAVIRMMVVGTLEDLGHSIAAEAGHIGQAMALSRSTEFDLAVLDVNIVGQMIFPVADLIQERGLPFIFATGYGEPISPKRFQGRPALIKPFTSEALSAAINRLCAAQSIVRERGAGGEDLLS